MGNATSGRVADGMEASSNHRQHRRSLQGTSRRAAIHYEDCQWPGSTREQANHLYVDLESRFSSTHRRQPEHGISHRRIGRYESVGRITGFSNFPNVNLCRAARVNTKETFMRLAGSIALALFLTGSVVMAQQSDDKKPIAEQPISKPQSVVIKPKKKRHFIPAAQRVVIPPATVLHNPEYLSGEASVTVAANSSPLIRIGMAQNGVTLIEFPSADKFFAVHAGNSDLCHPAPVRLNTLAIGSEISWAGVPTQIPPPSTEKVLRPLQEFFPHLRS